MEKFIKLQDLFQISQKNMYFNGNVGNFKQEKENMDVMVISLIDISVNNR